MKKILIILVLVISLSMISCSRDTIYYTDQTTTTTEMILTTAESEEIRLGYSTGIGGQIPFPANVAITIPNSLICDNESGLIIFEYGSWPSADGYITTDENSSLKIVIYTSRYKYNYYRDRGGEAILYEENIDNLFSPEYHLDDDASAIFSPITYNNSVELSVSSDSMTDIIGYLYFVIEYRFIDIDFNQRVDVIFQEVSYVVVDGCLSFYN